VPLDPLTRVCLDQKEKNLCYVPTYVGQFVTVLSIILIALLAANPFLYKIDSIFVYKIAILLDYIYFLCPLN